MNTTDCTTAGRQPASGLTPASLFSRIISSLSRWRSPLYFSRSFFISGWTACIFIWLSICFMNSRNNRPRRVKTRKTTDSTHAHGLLAPMNDPKTLCQTHMIPETG